MRDPDKGLNWQDEELYWRDNYRTRPYAAITPDYNIWRGAYRYGFEAARQYEGRPWEDIEPELAHGWSAYEHRGTSTWDQIKAAVRDAWDRVTGHRPVGTR